MNANRLHDVVGMTLTACLLAMLVAVEPALPALQREAFCRPCAWAASLVLGGRCVRAEDGNGYVVQSPRGPVLVSVACSAFRFFSVTVAVLAGLAVYRKRSRLLPALVLGAYAVTLAANTTRIVCARYARLAAVAWLPPEMFEAVHMGTGMLCFVMFLIAAYAAAERMMPRGSQAPA